jgi:biotin-(acetyl-CoA carboxylase) ligase
MQYRQLTLLLYVISGVGVNLNNKNPTTCINEMIAQINSMASVPSEKLAPLFREKLLAVTFTQLESLLDAIQNGHIQQILQLYYSYWLHRSADLMTPRTGMVELDNLFSNWKTGGLVSNATIFHL